MAALEHAYQIQLHQTLNFKVIGHEARAEKALLHQA